MVTTSVRHNTKKAENYKLRKEILCAFYNISFFYNIQELILKLSNNGIDHYTLDWIQNFLKNRQQCTILEGERSSYTHVTSGVPQGSILRPILLLAFINDLPKCIWSAGCAFLLMTQSFISLKIGRRLAANAAGFTEFRKIRFLDWKMAFNTTKCNVLRITRRQTPIIFYYKLHDRALEAVDITKYLAIHLSEDLRWNEHVRNISNKDNKTLGFLKRNLRHCSAATKERAYKVLIQPTVQYCSSIWDPYTAKNIKQLEMVQRRAARWVISSYGRQDSVTVMLSCLGWKTLEARRTIARLTMLYKLRNNLTSIEHFCGKITMTWQINSILAEKCENSAKYCKF